MLTVIAHVRDYSQPSLRVIEDKHDLRKFFIARSIAVVGYLKQLRDGESAVESDLL